MNGHPFDAFAELLARGVSRRAMLRGLAALSAVAAAHAAGLVPRSLAQGRGAQQEPEPEPPPFWPPEFPLDPPGDVIDDYVDCLARGYSPEECDKGFPWCELKSYYLARRFPNLTSLLEITPFLDDCGNPDCLQCCYVPSSNACHSSFIGENVINCRPSIYGEGTRGVGLTLLLAEPPPDGTCLFTPQVCSHVGMCLQDSVSSSESSLGRAGLAQAEPDNYLLDPRAIKQRARVFGIYALAQARHYIDEYATDSPDAAPLQSVNDALFGRGWATWRQDMASLNVDLNDPLFRVTDSSGALIESASRANVARLFAVLRLMTGLPNLAARLEYVESRVWSASAKAGYLAAIPDPDQQLRRSLDPHLVNILKRVPMLQDYQLLAAALAGEATSDGHYGGMALGEPPTLRLSATAAGATVTLAASLDDPTAAAGLARPLSVDWGDGHVTRHQLAAAQPTLEVSHSYAAAGRYAIYAVAANNSGLRGAAVTVVDVQGAAASTAQAASPTLVRTGLTGLRILNLPFTRDLRLALYFTATTGERFRAGRSRIASGPTNITQPVELGAAYAHNPSRIELGTLTIEPLHNMTTSGNRVPTVQLSTLLLGVFSTARLRTVDHTVALSVDLLKVYAQGAATPLPAGALTVNSDGSIGVPLLYRTASSAPWQRIERIELDITPELFDGLVLDATPTSLPVGTAAAWTELRPNSFTRVPDEPDPPDPSPPSDTEYNVLLPLAQR